MKKTLLEQIIYATLFEQRNNRIKKVDANTLANQTLIHRNVVKPSSRQGLAAARQHGSVLSGWSAFTMKTVYVRKTDAKGESEDPELRWTDSAGAAEAIQQATKGTKDDRYYGPDGQFNVASANGIPRYMYIVGPDVSKRNRVRKHNVWVCNFEQLYNISKQLNNQQPLEYYIRLENLVKSKKANIGNIIVFDFKDAATWFSVLSQRITQSKLSFKPEDSKVLIPELQYLSADYDPETEKIDIAAKTIEINSKNASQYNYPSFNGTARQEYDSLGNRIIIPIKGTIGVNKSDNPGVLGKFTGEFKNGAPWKGYIDWDDDTIFPYGELTNPKVTIDAEGNRNFSFSGEWQDKPVDQQTEPDIDPEQQKIDPIEQPEINNSGETTKVIYPVKTTDGEDIYTLSDTDPYVYLFNTTDNTWKAAKKSRFESGKSVTFNPISDPAAITKLNNFTGITPQSNNNNQIKPQSNNNNQIKPQSVDYKKGDSVLFNSAVGTSIPLYTYNSQTRKFYEDRKTYTIQKNTPKFLGYSSDQKYVLLDFGNNVKYWTDTSQVKKK